MALAFRPATSYAAGVGTTGVAVGDLNGDGIPDLVVANGSQQLLVLDGTGTGSFAAPVAYADLQVVNLVAAVDVNNDGRPDLVGVGTTGNLDVRLGNGTGGFGGDLVSPTVFMPSAFAIADLNKDGLPDVVLANTVSGAAVVATNAGGGTFATVTRYAANALDSDGVAVADLNGDGFPDLVVSGYYQGVSVLLGGAAGFAAPVLYGLDQGVGPVAVADVNGDGRPDIVVANALTSVVDVLPGNGNGTFGAATAYAAGSGPAALLVADMDGDGHPDIVVADATSDAVSVLLNDGSGRFAAPAGFAAGPGPESLAVADLNGDGRPDLVVGDYGGGVDVLLNASPACYCRGTAILTDRGEVPVERLAVGDRVVTASGRAVAIRWVGRRSYAGRFLAANPAVQPVRFRAGSLGPGLPRRDLLVSPEHALFLHGVLVPARLLVDGLAITRERGRESVAYFHVELDGHDLLLAEGVPAESFMDDDSLGAFHNAAERAGLPPGPPAACCAPRVTSGPALLAILRRLAAHGLARAG